MRFCVYEGAWRYGKLNLPLMSLLPLESHGWVRKEEKAAEVAVKPLSHPLNKKGRLISDYQSPFPFPSRKQNFISALPFHCAKSQLRDAIPD